MVDGPGFRTSIYCAGCPNHCPECHNPQSWDINHGTMTSTEDLMKEIMDDPFANVTFSGGDPMFQAEGFAELAREIRRQSKKTIWCFTGYKFENLVKNPAQLELLKLIDVLVDGPFVKALADPDAWLTKTALKGPNGTLLKALAHDKLTPLLEKAESTRRRGWNNYQASQEVLAHMHQLRLLGSIAQAVREDNIQHNRFLLSDTQYMLHRLIGQDDTPFI